MSGARVCEVLGLQMKHVDLGKETIEIEQDWSRGRLGPPKTDDLHRFCEIPGLAAMIGRYAKDKGAEDYLFARADTKQPPDDRDLQQHVFRPAAERAGVYAPGFGLQRFRHISLTMKQQVGPHPIEAMTQILNRIIGSAVGGIQ